MVQLEDREIFRILFLHTFTESSLDLCVLNFPVDLELDFRLFPYRSEDVERQVRTFSICLILKLFFLVHSEHSIPWNLFVLTVMKII